MHRPQFDPHQGAQAQPALRFEQVDQSCERT